VSNSISGPIPPPAGFGADQQRSSEILGHPTCLFTLFFTEMWERFSFYGMKALLVLYMVNYLFWNQEHASKVMAWYAGLVYATPIVGGWIADKFIGARWSVVIGGVLMAIGHFLLAFEPLPFFFGGLGFLIAGCGFLKPNISTQVGSLYRERDERRDSAFTIFYMGINLGAFIGPLICGWLRGSYGYHYGFAAAGVGMVLGLIVYLFGMGAVERRTRQIAAEDAEDREKEIEAAKEAGAATGAVFCPNPECGAQNDPDAHHCERCGAELPAPEKDPNAGDEVPSYVYRDRTIVLVVICLFVVLFWVGFEQAANVMNLWAEKHSNLYIFKAHAPQVVLPDSFHAAAAASQPVATAARTTWRDFHITAEQTQSINPFFIIVLAPVFAWLWTWLDKRHLQPSTPMKMAMGVFFATLAYGAMLASAARENQPTSATLDHLPAQFRVDEQHRVYTLSNPDDPDARVYYGATRLRYENGELKMKGVLPDLDWMRALGVSSPKPYHDAIDKLVELAEKKDAETRELKRKGKLPKNATWQVQVTIPPQYRNIEPVDKLPDFITWDAKTGTYTATDVIPERYRQQLLAAGAEPGFRKALTELYRRSSLLKVSIGWLILFYLLLTIGELCLSPVGLSLVTKAAPPKLVGLFMGLWFFTSGACANFLAHTIAESWGTMTPTQYFAIFAIVAGSATVLMLLLLRKLKPMLHGIN